MRNSVPSELALNCIRRWWDSLPLLSTDLLFQSLEARTGDYPELPAAILGELYQRCWLFPDDSSDIFKSLEWWGAQLGRSQFQKYFLEWAESQLDKRTYEMPPYILRSVNTEIEKVMVHYLQDYFCKWREAQGVIAFLSQQSISLDEDAWQETPPIEDILLPFNLLPEPRHEPDADFGKKSAFLANIKIKGNLTNPNELFLNFSTLGKGLPDWMKGGSGALAIWFALQVKERSLPSRALDVGLAGYLNPESTALDYHRNQEHLLRRKLDLFRRAKVPIIVLPDTGTQKDYYKNCQLWPHSQPIGSRMQELISSQIIHNPDIDQLLDIAACIVDLKESIDYEDAYLKLMGMMSKPSFGKESKYLLNVLVYACCCQLGRGEEAKEMEACLRHIPSEFIGEYWVKVRRAGIGIGGVAKEQMLKLAEDMRHIEQHKKYI